MRIVKSLIVEDKFTDIASRVFDEVITRLDVPIRSDLVEFIVRDSTAAFYCQNTSIVCLDYDNIYLQEGDERALRTIITRQLYKIFLLECGKFGEAEVNFEMIKGGHYDDLLYLYYNHISEASQVSAEDSVFLEISLSTFDNHDDNMLLRKALEKVTLCR